MVPEHHANEDGAGEAEIDDGGSDGGEGDGEAREVDFGDEAFGADDGVSGGGDGGGEEGPGEEAGVDEDGVGDATGFHFGHPAKEDGEDDHVHEGLEDGPGGAEEGLFVADFDIAPDEEEEEFAVFPELGDVDEAASLWRAQMMVWWSGSGVSGDWAVGADDGAGRAAPGGSRGRGSVVVVMGFTWSFHKG